MPEYTEEEYAAIPAQNIEAEQSALGSMMLEPQALAVGLELLQDIDFARPTHRDIFRALITLAERNEEIVLPDGTKGNPVDLITLQEELRKNCLLEDVGGTEYLMALAESVPTAANIEHYSKIVLKKSMLRQYDALMLEFRGRCGDPSVDVDQLSGWLSEKLDTLTARSGKKSTELILLKDILCREITPVEWVVEGLVPKHGISMLTGDSGVGKSWIVIALAYSIIGNKPFLDKFPVSQCNVMICDVEHDDQESTRRMRRLYEGFIHEDRSFPLDSPTLMVHQEAFQVDTPGQFQAYVKLIQQNKIGFVICDPFVHSLPPGADENSAGDCARFFEKVRKIQKLTGAGFLFVHHTRKQNPNASNSAGERVRGSSAIKGVLDSLLAVRSLRDGVILVEHAKSRQAKAIDDFSIVIEDIDDATVIQYGGESNEVADQVGVASINIERLLTDNQGPMFKKQIMDIASQEGLSLPTIIRALNAGVKNGSLERKLVGRNARFSLAVKQKTMWQDQEEDIE